MVGKQKYASHITMPALFTPTPTNTHTPTTLGAILEQPVAAECNCTVHGAALYHPLHTMACVAVFCDIPVLAGMAGGATAVLSSDTGG